MNHPFQCIATIRPSSVPHDSTGYLLAAWGPKLLSVSLKSGEVVSEWTTELRSGQPAASTSTLDKGNENDERPVKRQKTAPSPATLSNVIKLNVSPDHQHAVAVTDDKCVRVFDVHDDGKLVELSQRQMPKRPCAIQVLPDNATMICGDKFGDVYSLPLLPEDDNEAEVALAGAAEPDRSVETNNTFKPSASNLTVHTKRNRKALEAQMKQGNLAGKTKEPLKFKHKLLLGHVSMLTDVAYATHEVDGKRRTYIITADRDEHIRLSRGPPQSHVIEGYCLGHKEFVSKICVIPGTNLLISGGGDDWLGVWEWPSFKLRRKIDGFGLMMQIRDFSDSNENLVKTAVSGIWVVPAKIGDRTQDAVVLACEAVSRGAYFPFSELLKDDNSSANVVTQDFDAAILDIACTGVGMIVSLDARAPGSKRIQAYQLRGSSPSNLRMEKVASIDAALDSVNGITSEVSNDKSLDSLLYGVQNLRKRAHGADVEEEDGDALAETGISIE